MPSSSAAQSRTASASIPRVLAANQRWRTRYWARSERPGPESRATIEPGSERGGLDAIEGLGGEGRLQAEPGVTVGGQADEVGEITPGGEARGRKDPYRGGAAP